MKQVNNKNKKKESTTKKSVPKTNTMKNRSSMPISRISKSQKKHHNELPILLLILFVLILTFVGLHVMIPRINIIGDSDIEIPYNGKYVETGATAKFFNKNLSNVIEISNDIDTTKVGTYTVTYKVKGGFSKIQKKKQVKVVDKVAPVISLTGEEEYFICPKNEYTEAGFKATDDYDGDITDKVKVDVNDDKIIYTVKDSSNNEFSITRKINRTDNTKPTITLKGTANMYLDLKTEFKEPGYTASDNCSGDLTSKVIVSGTVTSKTKGTYTLTYTVQDDAKNKTSVTRKVMIADMISPESGVIKKNSIYLTFDDGPSSVTTGTILDILKEENVKATFFITNRGPDSLVKRMFDEGHTIAIHSATHDYSKIYSSVDNYFADINIVSNRIKRITGQESRIVRFPGGSGNTVSRHYATGIMGRLVNELFSRGYRYYDWNVDSGDASTAKTGQAVANNVKTHLSKSRANMVLMHDIKTWTRDGIRSIIQYGKSQGYTFETIDMDTYMVRGPIRN